MVGLNVANSYSNISSIDRDPKEIPVICLMGPTATGKTDAAAQLYEAFPCEIISVDSSLVYTGMDIGTAKPDKDFLEKYPHHLVDIRHPNDTYSVADFYQDAADLIKKCVNQGKVPVLAGGTMFYYNVLERGISDLPKANQALRKKISLQAQEEGWPALHAQLAKLDPLRAKKIECNDAQRIQRSLEIVLETSKTVAQQNIKAKPPIANPILKVALTFSDRKYLHQRIEQRFDIMLELGLQNEIEQLLAQGVNRDSTAMKMIGYRQMLEFLDDDITYQTMRDKGVAATRQLAKRQLTWLRNQKNLIWWMDVGLKNKEFQPLMTLIKQILL